MFEGILDLITLSLSLQFGYQLLGWGGPGQGCGDSCPHLCEADITLFVILPFLEV